MPGLLRADAVGPHHLVVFVFDDVAVPHVLAGGFEVRADPGHLAGQGDHGVFDSGLPRSGQGGVALELDGLDDVFSFGATEEQALAVDHLEGQLVDVHRVRVGGGVVDLPNLGVADPGVLGHLIHP